LSGLYDTDAEESEIVSGGKLSRAAARLVVTERERPMRAIVSAGRKYRGVQVMRHPFDGINEPAKSSRRGVLGMFAAVAGFFGFTSLARAVAPPTSPVKVVPGPSPEPPTAAAGEAGGKVTEKRGEAGGPKVTTLAAGEEGASTRAAGEEGGRLTTKAIGEEGGKLTGALREAGGPPIATTLAIGEEGGKK
jgi:hypothetical protein